MRITRRQALTGSAATAATLATGIFKPAIADTSPIQIGYLPAFTGPSSSTGIGIGRGTQLAVDAIHRFHECCTFKIIPFIKQRPLHLLFWYNLKGYDARFVKVISFLVQQINALHGIDDQQVGVVGGLGQFHG